MGDFGMDNLRKALLHFEQVILRMEKDAEELATVRTERGQLEAMLSKAEDEKSELKQERDTVKQELSAVEQELLAVKKERDTVKQELSAVERERNTVKQELSAVKQERNTVKQELSAVKQERNMVKQELSAVKPQMELLKNALEEERATKEELMRKMQLRNQLTQTQRQKGSQAQADQAKKLDASIVKAIEHHLVNTSEKKVDMLALMAMLNISDRRIRELIKRIELGKYFVPRQQGTLTFWAWMDSGHKFHNTPK